MSDYCGQCRQFTRTEGGQADICGAWDQPTQAKRAACGFFIPRKPKRGTQQQAGQSTGGAQ
ncbi:hypothetical protein Q2Y23_001604 [Vibrio fluvialis]|uniref:hypothetical protein n=1 Tax=Vibrio fluvialis TaxID=676 RepID=UPI001558BC3B|nr:hypothetical protein [Vibrio fluvialis]TNF16754.1 MAG: hypothetical protein EP325_07115 [Vibrionaceae bacterium]EKO3371468.1 hypothetical protein [Vibrio fluvialis]EKO3396392.1 hypothetical protein [Vibrio fluvialis]EKO3434994.1 hypothetical protein [Vibrio fluvialis]EKO3437026.1 hypothetical protein [Vibrio fluvialis]